MTLVCSLSGLVSIDQYIAATLKVRMVRSEAPCNSREGLGEGS